MLTPIKEFPDYKKYAKELEKARADFVEKEINFGKLNAITKKLEITLGVDSPGSKVNWAKIQEADQNSKIAKRELDLVSEKFGKVEIELGEKIKEIKEHRRVEARKVGLKINRRILKIMDSIEKVAKEYMLLARDINQDLSKQEKIDRGDVHTIIGPNPAYIMFGNRLAYPTEFYLKQSKKFKKEEEKEEFKDI